MDKSLFDSIVQQLLPQMSDEKSRMVMVESVLFGSSVVDQIDWSGTPSDYTRELVNSLRYDSSLLVELLTELKNQASETRHQEIDTLIEALTTSKTSATVSFKAMRIFISYAHIDIWQIQQLASILRDAQHEVWFDPDLKPGEEWKKRLADEIAACDVLLYALSNESVESEWCQWELDQAIKQKKRIMPVIVRPKTPVQQMLSHIQYIDFSLGPTPELIQRLLVGLESLSAVIETDNITGVDPETSNSLPAQAEKQRKHVFISYHQANITIMEDIQACLRQENIPVWTDESNKTGALFWEDVIEEAIRNAGCLVAIMSPEARHSARVRGELAFADDCGVKIIPVIASGERSQVLSTSLYARNPVDLRYEINLGMNELLNSIYESLEAAPTEVGTREQRDSHFQTDLGFWDTLVRLLRRQRCVPFIGPGIDDGALPSKSEIAHKWAEQSRYPFESHYARDLARVAHFITIDVGAFPSKDDFVETWISGVGEPDFDGAQKPYRQLAELDFPVFLTTNYHDFLYKALENAGKEPRRVFYFDGEWEASHDDALDSIPTVEQPLVFHLYGHQSVPESLILSEDDYLTYLVKTARNLIKLPTTLLDTIGKKSYLFIGFTVTDWDLRTLLHILSNQDRKGKEPHIAAQIEPIRSISDEEQERRVKKYLEGVFRIHLDKRVNLYIGKTADFLSDLRENWENLQ